MLLCTVRARVLQDMTWLVLEPAKASATSQAIHCRAAVLLYNGRLAPTIPETCCQWLPNNVPFRSPNAPRDKAATETRRVFLSVNDANHLALAPWPPAEHPSSPTEGGIAPFQSPIKLRFQAFVNLAANQPRVRRRSTCHYYCCSRSPAAWKACNLAALPARRSELLGLDG